MCDFEDKSICGYQQLVNDDFDWTWNSGATGSSGTGPMSDHSYGTTDGMSEPFILQLESCIG